MKMHRTGVQTLYTEDTLCQYLWVQKAIGRSLREIARDFPGITHADVQRGLDGDFPKHSHKRAIMGLPALIPAPACPRCGKVHVTRRCTERLKNREYRDLWDMPVTELRRRLEQRTEF